MHHGVSGKLPFRINGLNRNTNKSRQENSIQWHFWQFLRPFQITAANVKASPCTNGTRLAAEIL